MPPPQANATVTGLAGAGVGDDWDVAASAGASKWTGEARAYYREATDRSTGPAGVDVLERRELYLETADVELMALDTDDVITFAVDGLSTPRTAKAKVITRRRLASAPGPVQTTKVELEVA